MEIQHLKVEEVLKYLTEYTVKEYISWIEFVDGLEERVSVDYVHSYTTSIFCNPSEVFVIDFINKKTEQSNMSLPYLLQVKLINSISNEIKFKSCFRYDSKREPSSEWFMLNNMIISKGVGSREVLFPILNE